MAGGRWWRRAGASWKCLHSPRVFTEGSLKVHEQSLKEGTGFNFGIQNESPILGVAIYFSCQKMEGSGRMGVGGRRVFLSILGGSRSTEGGRGPVGRNAGSRALLAPRVLPSLSLPPLGVQIRCQRSCAVPRV